MQGEQLQQNAEFSLQRRQSDSKDTVSNHSLHSSPFCSFLHHYASVQEMTDGLTSHSFASPHANQPEQPSLVDYVDQFLWNSTPKLRNEEDGEVIHLTTTQVSTSRVVLEDYPRNGGSLAQRVDEKEEKDEEEEILRPKGDLSKDYRKNLAGYIVKKVLRILISPEYSKRLKLKCLSRQVDPQLFKSNLQQFLPRLFGPNSIYELLQISSEDDRKMKQLLLHLVTKVLRKRYALEILKEGRMRDYQAYIQVKNQGLLYFSLLLS